MGSPAETNPYRRLDSWKEIAAFFERDERTVRRWEKERGLPVHRIPGNRGSVYAIPAELIAWLQETERPEAFAAGSSKIAVMPSGNGTGVTAVTKTAPWRISKSMLAVGALALALTLALAARFGLRGHAGTINSVVVLPFVNVDGDAESEYLSDGVTESIINSLSQLPNFRVVPRNSAFRYKKRDVEPGVVAKQLDVQAVVTGRVLRRGDSIFISAELTDAAGNSQIWGGHYSGRIADLLLLREEIPQEISEGLRLHLTNEEKRRLTQRDTESSAAYELYLKGRYHWNKRSPDNLKKAVAYFQ